MMRSRKRLSRETLAQPSISPKLIGLRVLECESRGVTAMRTRPRTQFVMKVKSRRCPKCGGKINSLVTRCKRCHEVQKRPKK